MSYIIAFCQICAITMILYKWFMPDVVTRFFRNHRVISLGYIVCGAIGFFSAIWHMNI